MAAGTETGAFVDAAYSAATNLKVMPSAQQQRNNSKKTAWRCGGIVKNGECLSVMFAFVQVIWLEDEDGSAFHRVMTFG